MQPLLCTHSTYPPRTDARVHVVRCHSACLRRPRSNLMCCAALDERLWRMRLPQGLCPDPRTPSRCVLSHGFPHDAGQRRPDRRPSVSCSPADTGALLSELAAACTRRSKPPRASLTARSLSHSQAHFSSCAAYLSSAVITVTACHHRRSRCRLTPVHHRGGPPRCRRLPGDYAIIATI